MKKTVVYAEVAKSIKNSFDAVSSNHTSEFFEGYLRARDDIAQDLSNIFSENDPSFDKKRFFLACGYSEESLDGGFTTITETLKD